MTVDKLTSPGRMIYAAGDAPWNMALDEALLLNLKGVALRFYTWKQPAVTIGRFQDAALSLNLDLCRQRGIQIVRRLTGGRAVYHHSDLTYSLLFPDDAAGGSCIRASYRLISQALCRALSITGDQLTDGSDQLSVIGHQLSVTSDQSSGISDQAPVTIDPLTHLPIDPSIHPHSHTPTHPDKIKIRSTIKMKDPHTPTLPFSSLIPRASSFRTPSRADCFAHTSIADLAVDGRKIIGSAQVRRGGRVLQQGSIRLWPLLIPDGVFPGMIGQPVAGIPGYSRDQGDLQEALARELAALFETEWREMELKPEEIHLTEQLVSQKYATAGWNFEGEEPMCRLDF